MRGPLCRALVLLALARAAVATAPAPTPAPTCADEWGPLVGVTSRNMSFPTAQYTNLFDSEVTARAQRRRRSTPTRARARGRVARRAASRRVARARAYRRRHMLAPFAPLPARRQTDLEALQEWWVLDDLEYTMSMRVTSTCDSTIRFGFQGLGGAGGFMIFDVPAGADAQYLQVTSAAFRQDADFHVRNGYASTISACVVACSDIRFGLAECEPTPSPTGHPTSLPTPLPGLGEDCVDDENGCADPYDCPVNPISESPGDGAYEVWGRKVCGGEGAICSSDDDCYCGDYNNANCSSSADDDCYCRRGYYCAISFINFCTPQVLPPSSLPSPLP